MPPTPSPLTQQHALIVDDEPDIRLVLRRFLESLGVTQIVEAGTGEEAIEQVSLNKAITLVLLDLKMPKLDGVRALKKIRKLHPKAKVIVLTGYPSFEGADSIFRDQSAAFLVKPVDLTELESVLTLFSK